MKYILISDFTIKEVPHGGSEWVNQVLMDNFDLEFEYSNKVTNFDDKNFYIISNISLMHPLLVSQIKNLNYVIMEHDYKICPSRHPWRYPESIIPLNDRINYDLYKNAKAVFVQTTDHMNVYLKNGVEANFVNLESSIWSEKDLELLEGLYMKSKLKNNSFAIYETQNWIKNTQGNIKHCLENNLEYSLVSETKNRIEFLTNISKCKGLVFYPIARETFCRLVVESKCLGLDIITSKNYGASLEPWFEKYSGLDLIKFLRDNTNKNLDIIEEYLNN
jgi:hypothetical protein